MLRESKHTRARAREREREERIESEGRMGVRKRYTQKQAGSKEMDKHEHTRRESARAHEHI